jgi:hypothetical protein
MRILKTIKNIYSSKHLHFLFVDYRTYKNWKWLIILSVRLNKNYVPCEIFRLKYKRLENIVIIALKFNGKNVKRRTNGYAKEFIRDKVMHCLYCDTELNNENATTDHIVPISQKGNNCQVNLVICCQSCNVDRGNQDFKTYLQSKNKRYKVRHPFV